MIYGEKYIVSIHTRAGHGIIRRLCAWYES